MIYTVGEIAKILKGQVVGDSNFKISMLSKIEEGSKGSLSFLANERYEEFLYTTKSSAVIVNSNLEIDKTKVSTNLIIVEDAYQSFAYMLDEFSKSRNKIEGIHKTSSIEKSASIGKRCFIGANVHISDNVTIGDNVKIYPNSYIGENSTIGNDTILYSGVKIYDHCSIGEKCFIQSGAIIGGDGFGFAPNSENEYTKVAQIGNVIIEDNVEIGANTTIDRATMGSTIIHQGVKLDNLIQIAHNVEIGKNTVIAAQSGVAGSTKIGENCMIGGQVGIVGHLKIGNNVKIAAQSGIQSNIKNNEIVQGSPAFSISDYKRAYVYFRQLPKLNSLVNRIEKELNNILSKQMPNYQHTISTTKSISGYGLHTGIKSTLTFKAAPINSGIKFIRTDLENNPVIEASLSNLDETNRRTQLKKNDAIVQTTEHLLAALAGLEIDNLDIEIDSPELPILDGSSKLYIEVLSEAGLKQQNAIKKVYKVNRTLCFKDSETGSEYILEPAEEFKVDVQINYQSKVLQVSSAQLNSLKDFTKEISDARTFVFLHEIMPLYEQGLIKGGSLNNAVVFVEEKINSKELLKLADIFNKKNIEVKKQGILNNIDLRYENEP